MKLFADAWGASDLPRETIVTIGNFDGLHRGQRETIGWAVARARDTGLQSVAVTFEPHPLRVLRPEVAPKLLTTPAQRERLFAETGVDVLAILRFTPTFAATPARRFVRDFLVDGLRAREVYVGSRFVFGKDREGDLSLLRSMGESFHFRTVGVEEVTIGGEPVSSTRVRRAVEAGEMETATDLLGRTYSIEGIVVRGAGRGRDFGFPTLNVATENELLPLNGVYVARVRVGASESRFDAVTNVGTRPTVDDSLERVVEAHLLDREADLYGERVSVRFETRLRPERAFPSVDALTDQIGRDVEAAREYFRSSACSTDTVRKNVDKENQIDGK